MDELESPRATRFLGFGRWARNHSKSILIVAAVLILAFWVLRGYFPALSGNLLPPSILDAIERGYRVCIMDIVIQPGETRQPTCGDVRVTAQAPGSLPAGQAQAGVVRAVCYKVDINIPYWTTEGVTRHEVVIHGRRVSKVALLRAGGWVTFPDNDAQDAARWAEFGCAAPYEVGATPDPGQS